MTKNEIMSKYTLSYNTYNTMANGFSTAPKAVLTPFYIHGYEFRKGIQYINPEAWVSVNYKLLTPEVDIFRLFRENNDYMVRQICGDFKVFLKFTNGKILIKNRNEVNMHDIEGALNSVVERLKEDMNYLKSKNKLPFRKAHNTVRWVPNTTQLPTPIVAPPAPPAPPAIAMPSAPLPVIQGAAGLVAIVYQPTPEVLSKLFLNNINYTLLPEFLIKQILTPREDGEITP